MHRIHDRYAAPYIAAVIFFLLVCIALALPSARYNYEKSMLTLHPSAALAFTYGEEYFRANVSADRYNIDRAEYFFMQAAALDPAYPYVYHELARISFLRGRLSLALAQIDFQISLHGESEPNSYYVRGLIEGYRGEYAASQTDYAHYLQFDSYDWAALNDYAWVLLKGGRAQDAANITMQGLRYYPDNPWLLNSNATAQYELGNNAAALTEAAAAAQASQSLTMQEWLQAYPGNDPKIAAEGIAAFKKATADNVHSIEAAMASSTAQSL